MNGEVLGLTLCINSARKSELDHVRSLKDLDLGVILLHPTSSTGLTAFSATSAAAPESARRQFIRAMEHTSVREFDEAIAALAKAAQIYPQYAAAHQLRGQLLERLQRRQAARAAYEQLAKAVPFNPRRHLGVHGA